MLDLLAIKAFFYEVHQSDVVLIRIRGTTMGPFLICRCFIYFFDISIANLCTSLILIKFNSIQFIHFFLYNKPEKDLSLKNFARFLRSKLLKIPLTLVNLTRKQ